MLIDLTPQLHGYSGEPVVGSDGTPWTVRDAFHAALNLPFSQPTPEEKQECHRITTMLFVGPTVELTIKEAAFIQEQSGRSNTSSLVNGRINEVLENAAQIPAASNGKGEVDPAALEPVPDG